MKVPFLDLKRQYVQIKDELDQAISRVVQSQQFILGEEVQKFETNFAKYCGTPYAVGCSSGTDALILSLLCAGVGKGDEVITSPFTFFSTIETILRVGARPVFVDIEPRTFNIDTSKIEGKITKNTKAIIPVHIFGQCANMDVVLELATCYKLTVIEDAAQAIGSTWNGKKSGSMGDYGCFSFFPGKNLGCFGDGGAVVTKSEESYRKLLSLRQHGLNPTVRYDHTALGGNFRLDAIQAAVLDVKLKYIDTWNSGRADNAEFYNQQLSSACDVPVLHSNATHVYNQYTLLVNNRESIRSRLDARGVPTAVYYPKSQASLQAVPIEFRDETLSVCNSVCDRVLSIPVFPDLTPEERSHITNSVIDSIHS